MNKPGHPRGEPALVRPGGGRPGHRVTLLLPFSVPARKRPEDLVLGSRQIPLLQQRAYKKRAVQVHHPVLSQSLWAEPAVSFLRHWEEICRPIPLTDAGAKYLQTKFNNVQKTQLQR